MTKQKRYRSSYAEGVALVRSNPLYAVSFARGYLGGYISESWSGYDGLREGARGMADGVLDELDSSHSSVDVELELARRANAKVAYARRHRKRI